ncbi:MAG: hypothetical protein VW518_02155 [Burkholderiaceae bacterium]
MTMKTTKYHVEARHRVPEFAIDAIATVYCENVNGKFARSVSIDGKGFSRNYYNVDDYGAIRNFVEEHGCEMVTATFA